MISSSMEKPIADFVTKIAVSVQTVKEMLAAPKSVE